MPPLFPLSDFAEAQFALQAVRQAALLARQVHAELLPSSFTKQDLSPVSVADYAAQAVVAALLHQAFPTDALVGEEDAASLRQPEAAETLSQVTHFVDRFVSDVTPAAVCDWIDLGQGSPVGRFWTLDPIDGTKGFLRGEQYAVALALIVDGQVELGVLGCPNLVDAYRPDVDGIGSLVLAVRGQGSWVTSLSAPGDFEQLRVSRRMEAAMARVLRSYEAVHTNVEQIQRFTTALGINTASTRMDSQAKYAVIAAGKAELMLRLPPAENLTYQEKIWDQAAGSLVLEEAGGRVTDLNNRKLDFSSGRVLSNNRGVIATNGFLHDDVIHTVRAIIS